MTKKRKKSEERVGLMLHIQKNGKSERRAPSKKNYQRQKKSPSQCTYEK